MNGEIIKKALQDTGITDMISCNEAWGIAAKAKVSKSEIGRYCSEHGIKIRDCQLGCFK
jgi:hypothetical protein